MHFRVDGKLAPEKLILCLIVAVAMLLSACTAKEEGKARAIAPQTEPPGEVLPEICPLDGQGLRELPVGRPLAVMIGNNPQARPQSGLPQADLVYEFPAEGGITRFMAVYYHGQAKVIGPVRSARPYFMDQALGWDAVFVHVGQSPQSIAYYKANKVDHIDEFSRTKAFWREKSRKVPDNLYTSTDKLKKMVAELKYERDVELPAFQFAQEPLKGKGREAQSLEIHYPEKLNRAFFQYEVESGLYKRFTGGKAHLDKETGQQLTAGNVIVQFTSARVFDEEGRMDVGMLGQGKMLLFSGGRVIEGTWVKKELRRPTQFFDATGEPVTLNPGQTWIQIVPEGTKVAY